MKIYLTAKQDTDLKTFLLTNNFSQKLTSKLLSKLILITINDLPCNNFMINNLDKVTITLPDEESEINLINQNLEIVYEDEYFLIVNKPSNLACIGTIRHYQQHLSGMIMNYYKQHNISSTVHFVNRLDYQTCGLVLIAKHQYIHGLFAKTKIVKKYLLQCKGLLPSNGMIDLPIKKDGNNIKRIIDEKGLKSLTQYELLSYDSHTSVALATLHTGRTHQIRLHFASIFHPLIGDHIYNDDTGILKLKSCYLAFIHPITLKQLEFKLDYKF